METIDFQGSGNPILEIFASCASGSQIESDKASR
jgi:hypothetical protein